VSRFACASEPRVARAVREGRWPEGLAAHARGCAACREAALVAGWLQVVAARAEAEAVPPDAARVWGRVALEREVLRRQELARRAVRPALWFQRAAAGIAAVATLVWTATAGRAAGASAAGTAATLLTDPWTLVLATGALLFLVATMGRAALDRLDHP
jgi:hypothetical protein